MPFPLGHTSIGFAVNEVMGNETERKMNWKRSGLVIALANLPDLDILVSLLFTGNGMTWHRGPSHSILFCLVAAGVFHFALRRGRITRTTFVTAFAILFSHVLADGFLTSAGVSFFWPLHVQWLNEFAGWGDVVHIALVRGLADIGIAAACLGIIAAMRFLRHAQIAPWNNLRLLKRKSEGNT